MRNRERKQEGNHSQSKPALPAGVSQQFKASAKKQPVQRFPAVTQLYRLGSPAGMEDQLTFETQHLSRDENGYGARYTQTTTSFSQDNYRFDEVTNDTNSGDVLEQKEGVDDPQLKISENELLAIHHTEQQPKEFFAEAGIAADSNQRLRSAGSSVILRNEGSGLQVSGNGPVLLRMVPGVNTGNDQDIPEKLTRFSSDECNEVMNEILGVTGRALVLLDKGRPLDALRGHGAEPTDKIRSYLSDNSYVYDGQGLKEKIESKPNREQIEYDQEGPGKYAKKSNFLKEQQAETLGMNEHARPEAGEGYVLTSTYPQETLNYAKQGIPTEEYFHAIQELTTVDEGKDAQQQKISAAAKSLMETWYVHYATVMARDGEDSVTLENYNRTPEQDWAIRRIFNKLLLDFGEFRDYVAKKAKKLSLLNDSEEAKMLVTELLQEVQEGKEDVDKNLNSALQQAKLSFDQDLNVQQGKMREMLFFQMYGAGKDSFHKHYTPFSSNPTTFHTRNSFRFALKAAEKNLEDFSADLGKIFKRYQFEKNICNIWMDAVFQSQLGGPVREAKQLFDLAFDMSGLKRAKDSSCHLLNNTFVDTPPKLFYFVEQSLCQILNTNKDLKINKLRDAIQFIDLGKAIKEKKIEKNYRQLLIGELGIIDENQINVHDLEVMEKLLESVSNHFSWFSYRG